MTEFFYMTPTYREADAYNLGDLIMTENYSFSHCSHNFASQLACHCLTGQPHRLILNILMNIINV